MRGRTLPLLLALALAQQLPRDARASEPPRAAPALSDGAQLRVAGGFITGVGALLCLPMSLGVAEKERAGAHIWQLVERAKAQSRPLTDAEFALAAEAHARAKTMRTLAITSGLTAGLLIAGGLTIVLLSAGIDPPPGRRPTARARRRLQLRPVLTPQRVGLELAAQF